MVDPQSILLKVLKQHSDSDKWNGSIFEHAKRVSNTKVGDIGQDFIEEYAQKSGFACEFPLNKRGNRAKQNPWDIRINGIEFELKTATEDVSGCFQFNHIRYHREYHAVLCLGISPDIIQFGMWTKAEITTGVAGRLVSMEKSANASYKLTKKRSDLFPISAFQERMNAFLNP